MRRRVRRIKSVAAAIAINPPVAGSGTDELLNAADGEASIADGDASAD